MELRTLTLAVMQKNDCCVFCRQTELIFLVSGIWTLYFKSRKSEMHCVEHWAKKNSKTSPQSLFKTRWDALGNHSRHFLKFEVFSTFLKIFQGSTLHGTVGKNFSFQKKPLKHVWTLGNNLENLRTLKFFWFFSWICSMYLPQILSPENRIQIFSVQKTDLIFLSLETLKSPAWNTRQKNSEKSPQSMFKTRLDTFENDFGQFWNLDNFLIFFWTFSKPDPPWNTGQFFFQKKCHKTCSKQIWTILGTILGFFAILNFLWFFCKNFRWLHGTLGKKIFEKIAPKHVWTLGNDFGQVLNFEFFPAFSLKFF